MIRLLSSIWDAVVTAFSNWLKNILGQSQPVPQITVQHYTKPKSKFFNCRVKQTREKKDNSLFDVFSIEMCGSIYAPKDVRHAALELLITDITDGIQNARPIHSPYKQFQTLYSPFFCYNADLGKLTGNITTIKDWMTIAKIHIDWLSFPRKGQRKLQFELSILARDDTRELAYTTCSFEYDNPSFGYIDLRENSERTKTLTVALAFSISAIDEQLYDCEIELIKNWANKNMDTSQASNKDKRKLDKALDQAVAFFRDGYNLDTQQICAEVVDIAPLAIRYDILNLCLRVAQANGTATAQELNLLKNMATWLEVDTNKFRTMMEKALPINIHQTQDTELILGVTADMDKDQTRRQINNEYRKWNARVTNSDSKVQNQAAQMLDFIAKARKQYIG